MSSTLEPSARVWTWTAIQQVLNQSGRRTWAGILGLHAVYTTKMREAGSPCFLRMLGRLRGVLARGNISETRRDTKMPSYLKKSTQHNILGETENLKEKVEIR